MKLYGIFVCMMLLFSIFGATIVISDGTLDQSQESGTSMMNIFDHQDDYKMAAQSFKPTMSTLCNVEVKIRAMSSSLGDLKLSIKSDLNDDPLTSLSKPASEISFYMNWHDFDFTDITVSPDNTYYIVLETEFSNCFNFYFWQYESQTNPYQDGSLWTKTDQYTWTENSNADACFRTYEMNDNQPPSNPTMPSGSTNGYTGISYTYETMAIDPNMDQLWYLFDWGDGTDSGWVGPYISGATGSAPHVWSSAGTYQIKAKAKDVPAGEESGWSEELTVNIQSTNIPPNPPSDPNPSNGQTNIDINHDLSWTCSDPDGDPLTYDVYFEAGDQTPDEKISTGQTGTTCDPGTMQYETTYYWKIVAFDDNGGSTEGPIWCFTTEDDGINDPPGKAYTPQGPTTLEIDEEGLFKSSAIDPNNDYIYVRFDWGDGRISPYNSMQKPSGTYIKKWNSWDETGTYEVKAQAKDTFGAESEWSEPLIIEIIPIQPDFSFIHITDLHYQGGKEWRNILTEIKQMNPTPSFVVCTGDIADLGYVPRWGLSHRMYTMITDQLSGCRQTSTSDGWKIKGTDISVFFCPGNHDAYNDAFIPTSFEIYNDVISDSYYTKAFSIKGHTISLFSLNSGTDYNWGNTMPMGDGLSNKYENEVTKFKNDLANSNSEIKIVLTHHPYIDIGIFYYYNINGDGTVDDFGQWCKNNEVDVVLSGHTHQNAAYKEDGVYYVTTDSIGGHKDESEKSCWYRIINVYPDGKVTPKNAEEFKTKARTKNINNPFIKSDFKNKIINFLENYPIIYKLLQRLLLI